MNAPVFRDPPSFDDDGFPPHVQWIRDDLEEIVDLVPEVVRTNHRRLAEGEPTDQDFDDEVLESFLAEKREEANKVMATLAVPMRALCANLDEAMRQRRGVEEAREALERFYEKRWLPAFSPEREDEALDRMGFLEGILITVNPDVGPLGLVRIQRAFQLCMNWRARTYADNGMAFMLQV